MAIESLNKLFDATNTVLLRSNQSIPNYFSLFPSNTEDADPDESDEPDEKKSDEKTKPIHNSAPSITSITYDNVSGLSEDMLGLLELIRSHPEIAGMFRITSGYRQGAKTKQGRTSWHSSGNAIDIVPADGYTFDLLEQAIIKYPDIVQYMQSHGLGLLNETSTSMMQRTGATGKHFHVGKDQIAITGLKNTLNKYGIKV